MLSRRQFLQAAGIALAAPLARFDFATPASAPNFDAVYGRALVTTPVYAAPNADALLIKRLWSDTVVPISETVGDWYRLAAGYAPRENLQPMIALARAHTATATPPFWGEVNGAIAIIRASCSASAPIVARVGHGAVLRVIDYLPAGGSGDIDWYRVALDESDALPGWTPASVWTPMQVDEAAQTLSLVVQAESLHLDVYEGNRLLLSAPLSTGRELAPGHYPITERAFTDTNVTVPLGAPWALAFGDGLHLSGAYWHNRFGARAPGAAIQVAPPLAKWLYPRAAEVIIS